MLLSLLFHLYSKILGRNEAQFIPTNCFGLTDFSLFTPHFTLSAPSLLPRAFVQPDNPVLNPRELILGTGTIKKKETN